LALKLELAINGVSRVQTLQAGCKQSREDSWSV
jgi:hypothetical protein